MATKIAIYIEKSKQLNIPKIIKITNKAFSLSHNVSFVTVNADEEELKQLAALKMANISNLLIEQKETDPIFIEEALTKFIKEQHIELLLLSESAANRAIASGLVGRFAGTTNPLVDLRSSSSKFQAAEAVYRGKYIKEESFQLHQPLVFLMSDNLLNVKAVEQQDEAGKVLTFKFNISLPVELQSLKQNKISHPSVTDAKVIVSVGRGASSPEQIKMARQLAAKLGAAVGHSRGYEDANDDFEASNLIGTSGQSVAPLVLLNLGISGAAHYISGIQEAGEVISVDSDPDAKIFDYSDEKIVGDASEVLRALLQEI